MAKVLENIIYHTRGFLNHRVLKPDKIYEDPFRLELGVEKGVEYGRTTGYSLRCKCK